MEVKDKNIVIRIKELGRRDVLSFRGSLNEIVNYRIFYIYC